MCYLLRKLIEIKAFFILRVSGSIFTKIQKILNRYFGKIEYVITAVNVGGNIKRINLSTIKDVDEMVININNEPYWDIQKIEKYRKYKFSYKNEIIHSPLHFNMKDITETEFVFNHDYSFLKKHTSLKNIKRVLSKHPIENAAS